MSEPHAGATSVPDVVARAGVAESAGVAELREITRIYRMGTNEVRALDRFSFSFKKGEYFSANILNTPAENILIGAEILLGKREDRNGNDGDDSRIQFTLKYSFGAKL